MRKITGKMAVLTGIALVLLWTACAKKEETPARGAETAVNESVVYYAMGTAWDSLNPYDSPSASLYAQAIWDKIYDRLAYISAGGTVLKPRNAESWESADSGRAVIFHLNRNAKWHDGTPVTAKDWVFTVNLITQPDAILAGGGFFSFLEGTNDGGKAVSPGSAGIEAVDDYTLKLKFKSILTPESFLILYNRNFYVLPEHLLKDIAPSAVKTAEFWKHPVGSGPTIFESELVGSQIVFKANRNYHLGNPGFGTLIINVVAGSNILASFIAGDLDAFFGNNVSVDERIIVEQAGFQVVSSQNQSGFTETILNNKTIGDPNIRLALHYALDKAVLSELATRGLGVVSYSYILPSSEYYNNSLKFERNIAKAKELLAAGKYDGRKYVMAVGQSRAELVAVMQQQWAEAGINVEILIVDVATMFTGLADGKYDIGLSGHSGSAEPLWFAHNFSYARRNDFSITDPGYDEWKDRINNELDSAKRKQLILDYQKFVFDNAPFIPLFHSGSLFVISKTVENIDYDGSGFSNENVWEWVKR
ncbi:MAG: ABC transporter substrate-binding protein [Treponema sp.]|jgi:peptide/nickel transport system substrate-binding protein|nr:ABC transporter substrate-binding protein [Treponema sp.]